MEIKSETIRFVPIACEHSARVSSHSCYIGDVAFRDVDSGLNLKLTEIVPGQAVLLVTGSGISPQKFVASA